MEYALTSVSVWVKNHSYIEMKPIDCILCELHAGRNPQKQIQKAGESELAP